MEAWITDISNRSCKTRFGKVIPKRETKIDVEKYFGRDVLKDLKNDPEIKVVVHNAKDLETEKKEAIKKEEKVKDFVKQEEARKEEVRKNITKKVVNE